MNKLKILVVSIAVCFSSFSFAENERVSSIVEVPSITEAPSVVDDLLYLNSLEKKSLDEVENIKAGAIDQVSSRQSAWLIILPVLAIGVALG